MGKPSGKGPMNQQNWSLYERFEIYEGGNNGGMRLKAVRVEERCLSQPWAFDPEVVILVAGKFFVIRLQ